MTVSTKMVVVLNYLDSRCGISLFRGHAMRSFGPKQCAWESSGGYTSCLHFDRQHVGGLPKSLRKLIKNPYRGQGLMTSTCLASSWIRRGRETTDPTYMYRTRGRHIVLTTLSTRNLLQSYPSLSAHMVAAYRR